MHVRVHERHQASRGGLNGSDASRWALLAVGEEFRGRRPIGGEFRRRRRSLRQHERHGNRRTRGAAGGAGAAFVARIVRVTGCGVVLRVRVKDALAAGSGVIVKAVGDSRRLNVLRGGRARHGRGHRTPHRECECQKDQEPDAKGFHCAGVERKPSRSARWPHRRPCPHGKVNRRDEPLRSAAAVMQ